MKKVSLLLSLLLFLLLGCSEEKKLSAILVKVNYTGEYLVGDEMKNEDITVVAIYND